ncbi:MAG: hypothetical protein Q7S27_05540 [Nanoarchaeota archaeon]|nr:hypothetical protein [Nanoarchaeota archaeon]
MRYINLLDKASNVKTKQCFMYNNTIFFAVPKELISRAIGPAAVHVRRIQEHLGKKVRIIQEPEGLRDANRFIHDLINPGKFKSLEIKDNCFIINAGSNQTKAILFGRNKRRLMELQKIVQDVYSMELKII